MQPYGIQSTALRYFLEVVRCGSISEASQRLNVAASAVSRQIAKLERELQTPLLERRARGVVPSAAGERLAVHARKAQLASEQVAAELRGLADLRRGQVRLATTEGFSLDFLPEVIVAFRQGYAGIHFSLEVCAPAAVTRRVQEGDADLGLTFSLRPEPDISVDATLSGAIEAVVAPEHPLACRTGLTLADLQPFPLALPMPDTTVRQLFDICCGVQGLSFEPVLMSNNMQALYRFAALGGGVALSSELSLRSRLREGQLVALPLLDEGLAARRIELQSMAGRELPPAVNAFRQALIAALGR
ncbi:DNA-binding transcriptional LysR family regulator [Pseudomonas sp. SORGH_AS199]|jgi:DNA-binding transcriptional LysR family regulator|uniref:LysR family transcriptional regulator n=1 Tax=Pseudomonas TaxID=286 RepID=UPI002553AF6A|nr:MULTISPECIES: LysR family transcriptional regulator [Pseudomonas]MDK8264376.1 LysR family transcriptional regulator [Pseudomonas oryzihabitans]MDR6230353.1 DNA-binding transcriptional LysR family regulator [Pseudomonas sp. SORGH_AS_0199]